MFRTMRELNAPPYTVLASVSSYHRGSLRLMATLPREIDDCTLLGRCTKYTRLPDSAGTPVNDGLGTSARAQPPNVFSTAAMVASGSTAPTISRNALFGR